MWCATCQADVAAEVTADQRLVRCATCGATLDTPAAARATSRTREARELLERWSSGTLFDPFGPLIPPVAKAATPSAEPPQAMARPDAAESTSGSAASPATVPSKPTAQTQPVVDAGESSSRMATKRFRLDRSHQDASTSDAALEEAASQRLSLLESKLRSSAAAPQVEPSLKSVAAVSDSEGSAAFQSDQTEARTAEEPTAILEGRAAPEAATDEVLDGESRSKEPRPHRGRAARSARRQVRVDAASPVRRDAVREPQYRVASRNSASAAESERNHADFEGSSSSAASPELPHPRSIGQGRRIDALHSPVPAPHFDARTYAERQAPRRGSSTSIAGQLLAYSGVLALTIGTAMVVWGYFGGPEHFAPTGWLITTAGQMLLFLGVVTLVSGGMEQTTDEVTRRIDSLGDRLIRIEQASIEHSLRGPSIPAERFAAGYDASLSERRGRQRAG